MGFSGSGTFNNETADRTSSTVISSTAYNTDRSAWATGLTNCVTKDGQTTPTANLPMGTYRHTGVGNASARTDYAATGQVQDGSFTWCGTAGGTKNALTLTPSPAITAYATGQKFRFKAGATQSDDAVTFAVSGLTTKAGQFNDAACSATVYIAANKYYEALYDGAAFQLTRLSQGHISGDLLSANNLSDVASAATAFGNIKQAATTTATGVVEKSTSAENISGTSDTVYPSVAGTKEMIDTHAIGKYRQYRVTDSTDITVSTTCAAGGVNVGSGQSITLAAGDVLRVTLLQADTTSTVNNGARMGIILNVNSVDYPLLVGSVYNVNWTANNGAVVTGGFDAAVTSAPRELAAVACFDVSQLGMETGAQTVQIKAGKTAAAANDDTFVLKGTTASRPTTFLLEHLKA